MHIYFLFRPPIDLWGIKDPIRRSTPPGEQAAAMRGSIQMRGRPAFGSGNGMALPPGSNVFEAAVLPHLDAAYNLARWLMRNDEDAEDVLHEAMLRALSYFAGFRGMRPRAWLLQIVRNTAFSALRHDRGVQTTPITGQSGDWEREVCSVLDLADSRDDPESALIRDRDRQLIDQLIASLPLDLREVLILRELEELAYKEIARITDAPIGTVMSRIWRARRMLATVAMAHTDRCSA
jgi:RNA polymerase sigma-70 factor (ECF subfamily)